MQLIKEFFKGIVGSQDIQKNSKQDGKSQLFSANKNEQTQNQQDIQMTFDSINWVKKNDYQETAMKKLPPNWSYDPVKIQDKQTFEEFKILVDQKMLKELKDVFQTQIMKSLKEKDEYEEFIKKQLNTHEQNLLADTLSKIDSDYAKHVLDNASSEIEKNQNCSFLKK